MGGISGHQGISQNPQCRCEKSLAIPGADPLETSRLLEALRRSPGYRDQIVHTEQVPPRAARYGDLDLPRHSALRRALQDLGMHPLYSHQTEALEAVHHGRNVVVATATASGKSLCYHLPVLEALLENPESRALYLFPTKALAQDQLRSLQELADPVLPGLFCATFDGDTAGRDRNRIKRSARVVITNPDMLHLGLLPNHQTWSGFLRRLRYVVVDEAHVYRGVFGSHVANVLRRLLRLCRVYGSQPQIIACSATIGNPREHLEALTGLTFTAVEDDGSAYGGKDFVFWNPPLVDKPAGVRYSASREATGLFVDLVRLGHRTLVFTRTRRQAELVYVAARDRLAQDRPDLEGRIAPYRAGYLPEVRRELERRLFEGDLLGATSDTALALGIDIGDLEATVLTGYPGSIAATWQQAGRSGRNQERSLTVLVAQDGPLDQYFMRHPEAFFHRRAEDALIDPENSYVLRAHLLCAAYEYPLAADSLDFGPGWEQARDTLCTDGLLNEKDGPSTEPRTRRWFPAASVLYPAQEVSIRSSSGQQYFIVDASQGYRLLETIDPAHAFFQAHAGAIYLHQGETYRINRLDLETSTAFAEPVEVPYYTQAKDLTDLRVLQEMASRQARGGTVHLGKVAVTTRVVGYKKQQNYTEEVLGEEPLDLPPRSFETVALWWDVPQETGRRYAAEGLDFAGTLHAAEHAAIGLLPLFALCDRADIGGISTALHLDTGGPVVFIYDGQPGGTGIAEKGYACIEELWEATLRTVTECPCEDGCPSCVHSPKCGNNNYPLDKEGARRLLTDLLGAG